jgi:hypothetical protein
MILHPRRILKSRADHLHVDLSLSSISETELELISAFLWVTRLGPHLYGAAANSLMTKIEDLKGTQFMHNSAVDVDLKVDILDPNGNVERSVGYAFLEIDV